MRIHYEIHGKKLQTDDRLIYSKYNPHIDQRILKRKLRQIKSDPAFNRLSSVEDTFNDFECLAQINYVGLPFLFSLVTGIK